MSGDKIYKRKAWPWLADSPACCIVRSLSQVWNHPAPPVGPPEFAPCSSPGKRETCLCSLSRGQDSSWSSGSQPLLYSVLALFHSICIVTAWSDGAGDIFQRTTWRFGHMSAININRRPRAKMPGTFLRTPLWKNVPSGVATRLPSTDTGFGDFEVGRGNFTAFFDSSKLLQNVTNVKKTKKALAAA